MQQVKTSSDYYKWVYNKVVVKDYLDLNNQKGTIIIDGMFGPSLKISAEPEFDKIGYINAIALIHDGYAYSSEKFITHHDSITALHYYLGANPLKDSVGFYVLGFSTVDDWFLDPWQAFKLAQAKKQIHPNNYSQEDVPLFTNQVLFHNKPKEG